MTSKTQVRARFQKAPSFDSYIYDTTDATVVGSYIVGVYIQTSHIFFMPIILKSYCSIRYIFKKFNRKIQNSEKTKF